MLKPFQNIPRIYDIVTPLERKLGFTRILKPGDFVVQVGVLMVPNRSDVWYIDKVIGPEGTIVAIEPDPQNIRLLNSFIKKNNFKCKVIVINKASFSRKEKSGFQLAAKAGDNFLDGIPESESWDVEKYNVNKTITINTDTIDNILQDENIKPETISHLSMAINGAEYESLHGMVHLLENSKNICLTITAGRESEGKIGFIDGRPDHEVIIEFLTKYGFSCNLKRFRANRFGYVIAKKGNVNNFM